MSQNVEVDKPYIGPDIKLPEITIKAFILGIVLSMLLAGANAYLGLFAGMTVSASIPAAVISMAVLRLFKRSNILENNIVQTAASAGESLAAGVIFTLPALALMGYWKQFNYWETTMIALSGGVLGVLFTIPLRTALIVKQPLKFPEGVATAEVLMTGERGGAAVKYLIWSSVVGGFMKFFQQGMNLWGSVFEKARIFGGRTFVYFGVDVSPALIAVGFIVGLNISFLVFMGGVISWWIAIPVYVVSHGVQGGTNAIEAGYDIWSNQIRYLGVGSMVVGGLWALVSLRGAIVSAMKEGFHAFKEKGKEATEILRTEYDTPMSWVLLGIGILVVPIFIIYEREIQSYEISIFMAILMIFAGFLFSAVAGYMAGLVGSSNNPISGVTIATILTSALILAALMGTDSGSGAAAAIMIGAVVCSAAAIAGDNMQDLKAGHVVGATPLNQQIMQMVGVISAALVMAPILSLLNNAYGFGAKTLQHPNALTAPQASLMASVAEGVFGGHLPWDMIIIGMLIGVAIIVIDLYLEKIDSDFRMPVLAVAVGIYLPFELDSAIMVGGVIAWMVKRYQNTHKKADKSEHEKFSDASDNAGLLFSSGLITGEALMGIILAIPIAYYGGLNIFGIEHLFGITKEPFAAWPGLILLIGICYFMYRTAVKVFNKGAE